MTSVADNRRKACSSNPMNQTDNLLKMQQNASSTSFFNNKRQRKLKKTILGDFIKRNPNPYVAKQRMDSCASSSNFRSNIDLIVKN